MIWVDREVKKIKQRKSSLEWVDDMKTPSGRIHIGSLRGVIVHDLLYKVLLENDVETKFSYVFNDMDQMKAVPSYLDQAKYEKYMGCPVYKIPSPVKGYKNYSEYFAREFIETFEKLNCHPQIIWSSQLYYSGKMNKAIEMILNKAEKVREIYFKVAKAKRNSDWYPFQVICEKCGKVGTTYVYKWDGENVYYRCKSNMVTWATGCSYEGKISPYDGRGKLVWKLDWPAQWKTIGVTVECSGKDHMSAGGSYDMGKVICEEVLNYKTPYAFGYEWFTIGGKKMSSSKGIGTSAKEVVSIMPPDVFRFFMVRNSIDTHIEFDPYGETIPRIFDDYDRCMNAYFDKLENRIPQGKRGEITLEFARIMELSEVRLLPDKRIFLPRFRTIVNLVKTMTDLLSFFRKQKGEDLNPEEREILEEREIYAQVYLKNYATPAQKTTVTAIKSEKQNLSDKQKKFLTILTDDLVGNKSKTRESIQQVIFRAIKKTDLSAKEAYQSFYLTLTGKNFGPNAADLILEMGTDKVIVSLQKSFADKKTVEKKETHIFPVFSDKNIFSINPKLTEKFPSITIGIAIIKNISISDKNAKLNKEIDEFLQSQSSLTTEMIGQYPEIQSYRRLYREMKIDWHSRRPSPEALLRRIALKKGLYKINTCVDAYNLVVMKNRVSSGAFDLDKIKFPTVIRLAKEAEEILLLGDDQPTKYKPTEIAYFDQVGGYNIDFNYRDAQRTAVTNKTKNILINIDGVYDITREKVEKTLKETIDMILKYCGGEVEAAGVVSDNE